MFKKIKLKKLKKTKKNKELVAYITESKIFIGKIDCNKLVYEFREYDNSTDKKALLRTFPYKLKKNNLKLIFSWDFYKLLPSNRIELENNYKDNEILISNIIIEKDREDLVDLEKFSYHQIDQNIFKPLANKSLFSISEKKPILAWDNAFVDIGVEPLFLGLSVEAYGFTLFSILSEDYIGYLVKENIVSKLYFYVKGQLVAVFTLPNIDNADQISDKNISLKAFTMAVSQIIKTLPNEVEKPKVVISHNIENGLAICEYLNKNIDEYFISIDESKYTEKNDDFNAFLALYGNVI